MLKMQKLGYFYTPLVLLLTISAFSETELKANPDYISSGLSWTTEGIPSAHVGDVLSFHYILIGGMLETRNEKRFNQGIFPNHDWRGVATIEASLYERRIEPSLLSVYAGFCHESAHATMGIREPTEKAFDLIYDDVYRRMMLNSINVSGLISNASGKNTFLARVDYNFYFCSKNTPELTGSKLGSSNGVSAGAENRYRLGRNTGCYISLYDRYIVEGSDTDQGYVHVGNDEQLRNILVKYPIIDHVNTVVIKTGFFIVFNESHNEAELYAKVLYGNSYGFIDSRDTRLVISFGLETSFKTM
jgi:hypothetical protein